MDVDCGEFPSATDTTLEVDVLEAGTYSILVNGSPTACTDVNGQHSAGFEYSGLVFFELADVGAGGITHLDNIIGMYLTR